MPDRPDDAFLNRVGGERIADRQINELIGLARGLAADGALSKGEVDLLESWLAANVHITNQPLIRTLYKRVGEILADGVIDDTEQHELLETLNSFSGGGFELGELLKSSNLPLTRPEPELLFPGKMYCFTGTFMFGKRKHCEDAVATRGGACGALTKKINVLVVGVYATQSWKHSAFGNKIIKASEWREGGVPIDIVSEEHWTKYLKT